MKKKVLITGAARGLGKSIAIEFASHDYNIAITYLKSKNEALKTKNFIEKEYGVRVDLYELDLRSERAILDFAQKFDSLDVLINNAAWNEDKNFDEFTAEDFLTTYRVNTVAPYLLSNSLKNLLAESQGSIVNIASTNGIATMYKESTPYDASKAALINLTKNMSVALAPNIRVNAVAPGWIDTPATEDMEPSFKRVAENSCVLHRFANPRELAKTVYFLASPDASYITGSIIVADGGNKYGNR